MADPVVTNIADALKGAKPGTYICGRCGEVFTDSEAAIAHFAPEDGKRCTPVGVTLVVPALPMAFPNLRRKLRYWLFAGWLRRRQ